MYTDASHRCALGVATWSTNVSRAALEHFFPTEEPPHRMFISQKLYIVIKQIDIEFCCYRHWWYTLWEGGRVQDLSQGADRSLQQQDQLSNRRFLGEEALDMLYKVRGTWRTAYAPRAARFTPDRMWQK